MTCEYCNTREAKYQLKNGKWCCEKNYQSCKGVTSKSGEKIRKHLKKQYKEGSRISHFKKFNDGSFWTGRTHSEESRKKMSNLFTGRKMSESFREGRREEMKKRYASGWESKAGRTKKIKYRSPIAGDILIDGQWELAVCKYLDSKNIKWDRNKKRFPYIHENKERTYCPDFYLIDEDFFIEVKGYKTDLDQSKWDQFPHKLKIWDKKYLKEKNII